MKRFFIITILIISLYSGTVNAHPHYHGGGYGHYRYSSCSNHVYIVRSDYNKSETNFSNCNSHYLLTKTTTNYYSNGTRRTFSAYTILKNNGEILAENCSFVKHIEVNKEHYFIVKKDKICSIINSVGNSITTKDYRSITELAQNRFLVKYEKFYGIIDINENFIVKPFYNKFKPVSSNSFLTKLNGYYGLIDINGKMLLKNKYDKITPPTRSAFNQI